ncbi:hypothetical protein D1013_02705 [Euzebyella marina]|uniref:DUF2306 domain-containing protein n=1 Tax=Euzebyella marina TaxID=1761453 RepID=A0A3G2L270_9FLAO|nr:hypothetical protein [Euzebyella marina]AYN66367.1 hypothetical protein D1013_02705 [Euzebyella marina]
MKSKSEHIFFKVSAICYALIVFWGFAPSFYLSRFFDDFEPLPLPLILHGIVFTIWMMLYIVQVILIGSKKYTLHKRLGIFGVFVMILMIPTGLFPVLYKYEAGLNDITLTGHNVFRLFSGYALFVLAVWHRKNSFFHKRLMLGCMVMLMSAAIFRISMDLGLGSSQIFNKGIQVLPAICLLILDMVNYKRVVCVDLISVVAVFAIFFLADYFWLMPFGEVFANFLLSIFVEPFI